MSIRDIVVEIEEEDFDDFLHVQLQRLESHFFRLMLRLDLLEQSLFPMHHMHVHLSVRAQLVQQQRHIGVHLLRHNQLVMTVRVREFTVDGTEQCLSLLMELVYLVLSLLHLSR